MKNNLLILLTIIGLACSKKEDPKPISIPTPTPVPIKQDTVFRDPRIFNITITSGVYVSENTINAAPATYVTYYDTVNFSQGKDSVYIKGVLLKEYFTYKISKLKLYEINLSEGYNFTDFDIAINHRFACHLIYRQGIFYYLRRGVSVKDYENKWTSITYNSKLTLI